MTSVFPTNSGSDDFDDIGSIHEHHMYLVEVYELIDLETFLFIKRNCQTHVIIKKKRYVTAHAKLQKKNPWNEVG